MTNHDRILQSLFNPLEYLTPVEWAEKYRYLSKDITPFPGMMDYSLTPYLKEIVNCVMPDVEAQIISIMKGSQLGFSIGGIFTILGWIMSQSPSNTLFITENEEKIKEQMQGAINQMIMSANLSHLVGNHNMREFREAKGRRNTGSGDTVKGFKFKDGVLYTYSGQKVGTLSSISCKYGLYDEVERWKGNYAKSGSFEAIVDPRHRAFKHDRKLFYISTPELKHTSNIEPLHDKGDQRKYNVPCKRCGEFITLEWSVKKDGDFVGGMYYKRDKTGRYVEGSTEYVCQSCGKAFTEVHKYDMYEEDNCIWKPTAQPISKLYRSYQIGSQYAPAGFYSWEDTTRKWCEATPMGKPKDKGKIQAIVNQEFGKTYEDKGKALDTSKMTRLCRSYPIGIIPTSLCEQDGNGRIVLITLAADLNGIMGEQLADDDVRLDWEVRAWTSKGDEDYVTSYSIDHGSIGTFIEGSERRALERKGVDTNKREKWTYRFGVPNSVWDVLEKEVLLKKWQTDQGEEMMVGYGGIDTGNYTMFANEFVKNHRNVIGLKGASETDMTKFKDEKSYFTKGSQSKLYIVRGNKVKDKLADSIELKWNSSLYPTQPLGYLNFPQPENAKYTSKYFRHYNGEVREVSYDKEGNAVGMRWNRKGPNHFFDVAVYNSVLQKIAMFNVCKGYKIEVSWDNFCSKI